MTVGWGVAVTGRQARRGKRRSIEIRSLGFIFMFPTLMIQASQRVGNGSQGMRIGTNLDKFAYKCHL
ncbi:MAG: hypothetical protein DWQ07_16050 [Chloroflexi bacterium]|nr:MAG: hypothetical protein DWQ07_16050 [Chloroflexota bacterium]MBL1195264.1 hypothetical protein [Chloroflexota bacterium]